MKNRNLKLFAAVLAVVLVASVSIFYACNKEEQCIIPIVDDNVYNDYEAHIKELMTTTGIDIYKLSQLTEVKKISEKQRSLINATTVTLQAKGSFTDEKAIQIQNLGAAISAADAAGNEGEVLRLFESLCAICRTIDGFIFGEDEYGLQTFTYDPDEEPVMIPITQMDALQAKIVALQQVVTDQNLQFSTLPQTIQTDILAAIVYVDVQNTMAAKAPSDCSKAALNSYAAALSLATVRCGIDLARCAFAGPAAGVCCAVVGTRYAVDVAVATIAYRQWIKHC